MSQPKTADSIETVRQLAGAYQTLTGQIGKVIVGQQQVVGLVSGPELVPLLGSLWRRDAN